MPEDGVILIVDDEEMVVTSLSAFLELDTPYRPVTFTSPSAALEFASKNEVDLVISDYLMPEMDGLSFLLKIRELRPEVPRIILTGYADKENAIKAINELGLYQYVEKPWSNDDLKIVIRNGLERKNLLKRLHDKIGEVNLAHGELQSLHEEILKTFV